MIMENAHKYSISALCRCLGISRSAYYYKVKSGKDESKLDIQIKSAFKESRCIYGSRKIKNVLSRQGVCLSKRKICRIMKRLELESVYSKKKYRKHNNKCNQSQIPNLLDRKFDQKAPMGVVVSDLSYVRVGSKWQYICILVDLYNREIIGQSSGAYKDAQLVRTAFASVKMNLFNIQMFHTDRGGEFDNILIDELLETFKINRSLSLKGCPYDNAVAEATFKAIKTEFVNRYVFKTSEQLAIELADYVHWFNNIRLHSTLGYQTPVEFRNTPYLFCKEIC